MSDLVLVLIKLVVNTLLCSLELTWVAAETFIKANTVAFCYLAPVEKKVLSSHSQA